ncbi:MAG: histidine kinase dimerization/phospho-acceptor domain-containing protein, partial [Burkholderiales bacterium]
MSESRLFPFMVWPFTKEIASTDAERRDDPAEERRRLAGFVHAFPDPVLVLDRNGVVIIANDAARGVLDVDPEGQHLSSSIRVPAVLEAVAAALAGHAAVRVEYEVRVPLPRHFDVYVSPIPAIPPGEPSVLLVLKDLTREQQIERMRADFVANASHELRTPLAALSGFIETLMGAARNDANARDKFLETMRVQAERMKRLIDDLLSLSRIEMNVH